MGLWNRIVQKMSKQTFKMVQERGNGFYAWNGRLYHSDVVRAVLNMAPVDGGDRLLRRKDTGFMEGGEEE